jgi:hypothetical protein
LVQIVGLNASWTNFSDLIAGIRGYLATHHLSSSSSSSSTVTVEDNGSEEDIVVVVDAYDILLLPSMRRLVVDTVATAATPVLISSEEYPYPEEILAWRYPHAREAAAAAAASSSASPRENDPRRHASLPAWTAVPRGRFLNSGIIVGPAKYLRHFFADVFPAQATIYADDQHQWARYYLETQHHPTYGLLTVDTTMHLAFSTYKHGRMSSDLLCMWPVLLCFYDEPVFVPTTMEDTIPTTTTHHHQQQQQQPQRMEHRRYLDLVAIDTVAAERKLRALMRRPIYAIHGNNKPSNTLYAYYAEQIATATQQYLSDPWREDLLQLLWAWYDGDVPMVDRYLQQFDAIRTSTTRLDGTMQSNGVAPLSTFGQEVIRTISQCRDMFATSLV